jgi:hypothetical protein
VRAENRRVVSDPQEILGDELRVPRYVRLCKLDALGRIEHLVGSGGPVARRVACGSSMPGSGLLARFLMRRERRSLAHLSGLTGVPRLVEDSTLEALPSPDGYTPRLGSKNIVLRSWCEGQPLHRATELPLDFFERLDELVLALHARGVCHNDLHKEQNVMVAADGYPALIDFQLASLHRVDSYLHRARCRDDLRHVQKHRRRYTRDGRGPAGSLDSSLERGRGHRMRRSLVAFLWRRSVKPIYHFVTRKVLRSWDGEERRESSGPWPQWVAAVGPRSLS